jgi:hypothetical protein
LGFKTSSKDCCNFSVEKNQAVDPNVLPEPKCITLASTTVTNDHEVRHFKDIEIAFLLTSDSSNFRLIGHTILARKVDPFEYDRLSLSPQPQPGSHAVERTIGLTSALYLALLKWASNSG